MFLIVVDYIVEDLQIIWINRFQNDLVIIALEEPVSTSTTISLSCFLDLLLIHYQIKTFAIIQIVLFLLPKWVQYFMVNRFELPITDLDSLLNQRTLQLFW